MNIDWSLLNWELVNLFLICVGLFVLLCAFVGLLEWMAAPRYTTEQRRSNP